MKLQSFITISIGATVLTCLLFEPATASFNCGPALKDSPCYCEYLNDALYNFKCLNVKSLDIAKYLQTPDPTNPEPIQFDLEEFSIVPAKDETDPTVLEEIGEDVLGGRTARVIRIATPSPYTYKVSVNPKAFASSAKHIEELIIYDADLTNLDWEFTAGFTNLTKIHLQGIVGGTKKFASSLPTLSTVTQLIIASCKGAQITLPNVSKLPSIANISLIDNRLYDADISPILNPMAGAQLEYISLRRNELTIYPTAFATYRTLHSIDLSENTIGALEGDHPLVFTATVKHVDLSKNEIALVLSKDVFQGDFGQAFIKLDDNKLDKLEGSIFFSLTQTMVSAGGKLSVFNNPIPYSPDCASSLVWLVKDNYYLISQKTVNGDCDEGNGNRKPFSEINANTYDACDATEFTTTTTTTTQSTTTVTTTNTPSTTTEATTSTTKSTTSTSTQPPATTPLPDDTYQEQLAALFGLFAGLFLIVFIGFIVIIHKMNKTKKVMATGVKKATETIESAPKIQATNQTLVGGYSSQQQMTSFAQPQQPSVLPRVAVPSTTATNGNPASNTNGQQPRGLRRSQYY